MRALSNSLSSISLPALALAITLSAGPASSQTTHGAATDRTTAASERPRDDLAGKLVRRVIQRAPSSIPSREIVQVETEIPPGVESGWHVHPGEEVGYIIAGKVEMQVQGRPTVILQAGDGFLIPPRTPHNARDLGPETGRMLSTYLVEQGEPIATFVHQHADKAAH
ncbi:cupin domain-containing protein [Bradyrhizobium sp. 157]|uniref:cupin domain-containing protein n=1 Tax=Bradyrhizobium sp. 157 TaxID=2782631 RepID=UPI001FF9F2D0|nr:cupin domain-containing protein [Bradyrhizobium sp. 157]MCK1639391.1 cupin domain-containing protein [Bradyrhizobium sp. 157]